MSQNLSTETIVTIVFGIVASLLAIGAIIATVRVTRDRRQWQSDIEDLNLVPSSTARQRRRYFQLVRFTSVESLESGRNRSDSLARSINNTQAQ
ncbi:hypothetical protein F5Y08DRAFT_344131 [Xylaria arbuscula]|nr:hypothetical protein F5Y08DRAFT_344131 [Xylaria arbuscula]